MSEIICLIGLILMIITIYLDRKRCKKLNLESAIIYRRELERFYLYLSEKGLIEEFIEWENKGEKL